MGNFVQHFISNKDVYFERLNTRIIFPNVLGHSFMTSRLGFQLGSSVCACCFAQHRKRANLKIETMGLNSFIWSLFIIGLFWTTSQVQNPLIHTALFQVSVFGANSMCPNISIYGNILCFILCAFSIKTNLTWTTSVQENIYNLDVQS